MKKIILIFILFISCKSFCQYPVKQFLGSDSTTIESRGATKSRFINKVYADTTAANLERIKFYDGAQIYTNSGGGEMWIRDSAAFKWVMLVGTTYTGFISTRDRFGLSGEDVRATAGRSFSYAANDLLWDSVGNTRIVMKTAKKFVISAPNGSDSVYISLLRQSIPADITLKMQAVLSSNGQNSYVQVKKSTSITDVQLGTVGGIFSNTSIVRYDTSGMYQEMTSNGKYNYDYKYPDSIVLWHGDGLKVSELRIGKGYSDNWATDSLLWRSANRNTQMKVFPDSMALYQNTGEYYVFNMQRATTAAPYNVMVYDTALSEWKHMPMSLISGGGGASALSSITAATGTNTINNVNNIQQWQWNSLTGNGFNLSAAATTAANGSAVLTVSRSGAHAASSITSYGQTISNTHTGTSSTNIGLKIDVSGGSNNYALKLVDGSEGAGKVLTSDANGNATWGTGGGGVTTMAAIGSSPNDKGATISGSTLTLQPADATFGGVLAAARQALKGQKEFNDGAVITGAYTNLTGGLHLTYISGSSLARLQCYNGGYQEIQLLGSPIVLAGDGANYGVYVAANGKVSIGSTSAGSEALDITGNVRFSGALMPNNTAGTSGQVLTSAGPGSPPTWGDIITDSTYTPTLTGVSNVASSSVSGGSFHYIRAGNQVTVSGILTLTPTSNTTVTQIGVSLPVASNFGVTQDATGSGIAIGATYNAGLVSGDNTNDRIQFDFISSSTSAHTVSFTAMYTIK